MLISNKKMLLSIAISSSLFSISYSANANDHDHHDHGHGHESEHRQHGAHVHGVIEANIAQDGEHLLFEVTAPGADVVGFEHAPKNEEQKQILSQAVKTLNNPNVIFTLPKDAKCTLEEVHVSHNLTNGDDEHHDHDHDHDHDQHDGDHHKEHSKHGEFNAQYEYHCEAISQLNEIETQWFKHFTHSQKMTVQYLGDSGQKATTLTADAPAVTL